MLIKFNSILPYRVLKKLCKINNIKYVSKCNKFQLLNKLNDFKTVTYIQRQFRKKTMMDDTCKISLEKLRYPFISIKVNNFFFYYDFYNFIKYLEKTDNFIDPCTRTQITDKKINEINKLIFYYYGKNTTKVIVSPNMKRIVELNIITYCMYDIIKELNALEQPTINDLDLYSQVLPRMIYYARFLIKNHSKEDSSMVLEACIQSITNKTSLANLIKNYLYGLIKT
tara:strand:+ start:2717 stop:3394 length:678 start_codon:yes stop_codon:yes gene_type:complete